MNSIEIAKAYVSMGLSVFPVTEGKKNPPLVKWNELRKRHLTQKEIEEVFTKDCNIALACGELSGIVVVDIDSYKGGGGEDLIKKLPETPLTVLTPRGGEHRYFKYTKGWGNTVNQDISIDIRSEGGYVLLPPSHVILEDGKRKSYQWAKSGITKQILEQLPSIPEEVMKKIFTTHHTQMPNLNALSYGNGEQEARINEEFLGVSKGGRNNAISRLSLSLINRIGEKRAWIEIQKVNRTYNPPLPDRELFITFNSALRKARQSPAFISLDKVKRQYAGEYAGEYAEEYTEQPQHIPQNKNTLADKLIDKGMEDMFQKATELVVNGKKRGILTGYKGLDSVIGGFFPGQSYLFFADTSVGKSIFTLNTLINASRNNVKCMYFDLENNFVDMTFERMLLIACKGELTLPVFRAFSDLPASEEKMDVMNSLLSAVKDDLNRFYVWDLTKLTDVYQQVTWESVKECIHAGFGRGYRMFAIDHLHYFTPAETDHAVIGNIAKDINDLASQLGITIISVAHTKKGLEYVVRDEDDVHVLRPTLDSIHGSKMIAGHFKNVIGIKRNHKAIDDEEKRRTTVYIDKTKFGAAGRCYFMFDEKTLRFGETTVDWVNPVWIGKPNAGVVNAVKRMKDMAGVVEEDEKRTFASSDFDGVSSVVNGDSSTYVKNKNDALWSEALRSVK